MDIRQSFTLPPAKTQEDVELYRTLDAFMREVLTALEIINDRVTTLEEAP